MNPPSEWSATIELRRPAAGAAEWMARALKPESEREVPRARAEIELLPPTTVKIHLHAKDTGSARAALNTYLGWISLADRTARVASLPRGAPRA
jgi:tRNA threonylcarbamoyladenosine modification (KEOPS) complex  Pcc1 subunit